MPRYLSPETRLPSNVITLETPPAEQFLLTAGTSSGIYYGYIDQDSAGFIFDTGVCGSINPVDATINGYLLSAFGYIDAFGVRQFFLVVHNAPVDLTWHVSFTDNQSNLQSYSSLQDSASQTATGDGFLTIWEFDSGLAYVALTDGVTYTITASDTP